jgi:hypothetical protein
MDSDPTASDAGTEPAPGTGPPVGAEPAAPAAPTAPGAETSTTTSAPAPAQAPSASRRQQPPPVPQLVTELRELVVTYVKQQTIAPLRQLGRYVGFGIGGSLLLGFGVVFLSLAGLRALQTETGTTFTDDWSWVPYLIMIFVLAVGAAVVWLLRTIGRDEQEVQ